MENTEIFEKLQHYYKEARALEIPETKRQELIYHAFRYVDQFIDGIDGVKGFGKQKARFLEIGDKKKSITELIDLYQSEVIETGINAASGKHIGYIPGGGIFIASIADFIAAATNPYASVYYANPGAQTVENEVVAWMKKVFDFPDSSVGALTTGGSTSMLIAFTAARDKFGVKNEKVTKSVVYMTEQVHHSAQKALRILGLEDVIVRLIPVDEHFRMKTDELDALIAKDKAENLLPFLVVGTAGTTDTGTVDPLDKIADIAEKYQLWFHVDGAYGGFFYMTSKKSLFKGLERADSLIVDPHKSLFLPYGLGAVLIKDAKAALHSHYYTANYMQDTNHDELVQSSANLTPELSRNFRGLRLWLALQIHGIQPFIACLEEKILLTHYFRNQLMALGFNVGPEPDLSVSYFWYPFGEMEDQKNEELMNKIHEDGQVFLSSSIIDHRYVIRMAVLSFRTKKETIDEAVAMVKRCLEEVKNRE